jgi:hypothetical protein
MPESRLPAQLIPFLRLVVPHRERRSKRRAPRTGAVCAKRHLPIDRASHICYISNSLCDFNNRLRGLAGARPCTPRSLHFCQRADGPPGMSRYPAVLSFATPPAIEDSCVEERPVADNFLQKQQKQQKQRGLCENGRLGKICGCHSAFAGATRQRRCVPSVWCAPLEHTGTRMISVVIRTFNEGEVIESTLCTLAFSLTPRGYRL